MAEGGEGAGVGAGGDAPEGGPGLGIGGGGGSLLDGCGFRQRAYLCRYDKGLYEDSFAKIALYRWSLSGR
jgi:hypothetical protein